LRPGSGRERKKMTQNPFSGCLHEVWFERLETIAEQHSKQITALISGLETEVEDRKKAQNLPASEIEKFSDQIKALSSHFREMEKTLSWLKGAWWIIAGLISAVALPVAVAWLLKILKLT